MNLKYAKLVPVSLKSHPVLNEKWVQDRIAEDPEILGLGDVVLKDRERNQPRAGRLDLLLQQAEGNRRYEVEIQLGKADESHIIRTIEYWDIERKRYPQYEHTAVIVAEEITSRFLNVISLFNGTIPLVAIQMKALQLGDAISLSFTTVLDAVQRGLEGEDEEISEVTDRSYWEKRGSPATVALADSLLKLVQVFDPTLELKYNKFYIGLARQGIADNFVLFRPKKNWVCMELRLDRDPALTDKIEASGLNMMDYQDRWGRYRINLTKADIAKHEGVISELMRAAYREFSGAGSEE